VGAGDALCQRSGDGSDKEVFKIVDFSLTFSLYTFLEHKEIIETQKRELKVQPYYMKPTASLRMKDNELCRIVDD
jgi:hypothetical protein